VIFLLISTNVPMPSDPCPNFVKEDVPIGSLQFTITKMESDLDFNNGKGHALDGVPPLVLKSCACANLYLAL
jgi:hypothetical protein